MTCLETAVYYKIEQASCWLTRISQNRLQIRQVGGSCHGKLAIAYNDFWACHEH